MAQNALWSDNYVEGEVGSGVAGNTIIKGGAIGDAGAFQVPLSDRAGLNAGYFGGALLGHSFGSGVVSLEAEAVYTNNLTDAVRFGQLTVANHLRVQTADAFANLKLSVPQPFPLYGRFTVAPYVAGGAGGGESWYSATGYREVHNGGFAWQGKGGLDIHTGTPWIIDLSYRYIETPRVSIHTSGDYGLYKTGVQVVSVGLRYAFGHAAPPPEPPPPPPPPPPPEAPPPPPPPVAQAQEFVVYFPFDQSVLTEDAQNVVQQAAKAAQQGPVSVAVVGHTDTSGSASYNLRLSERRAKAVADALVGLGVQQGQMNVSWVGKTDLAVPTPDGVKEPLNRRATITLTPSGS